MAGRDGYDDMTLGWGLHGMVGKDGNRIVLRAWAAYWI
jgi:hypothetical protein